jgi:hypothetical protein
LCGRSRDSSKKQILLNFNKADFRSAFIFSKNPKHIDFLSTISLENWNDPNWAKKEIERIKKTFAQGAIGFKI